MREPILPRTAPRALVLGIGVGVVLLALLVVGLVFWDRVLPAARAEVAHDAADEAAQMAAARSAILAQAPEADSVTLGRTAVDWIGEAPAVCGRVDIEEPQDSLDGEERFVFVDGELSLESRDGTGAVDRQWKAVCDDV